MRIERQISNQGVSPKKGEIHKTEQSFRQTLASSALAPKTDVLTISHQPTTDELQKAAATQTVTNNIRVQEDAVQILPKDSTQTKLEKLRQIADTADYSGMSYTEIYCTIWDRYNSAFGGNLSAITSCLWEGDNWYGINNQFTEEVDKFVYNPIEREIWKDSQLRRRDKGYAEQYIAHGGKNFRAAALGYDVTNHEECELAIRQKYAGKNTLLDFLNMQGELSATGVVRHRLGPEGSFWYEVNLREQLKSMFSSSSGSEPSLGQFDSVLRFRVDVGALASAMRKSLSQANFSGFNLDMEEVIDKSIDDLLAMTEQ